VRSTLKLTVALAATWFVLAGPAWLLGGASGLVGLSLAAWLCWIPHLLFVAYVFVCQPNDRPLAALLLSMMIRLSVVLTGALVICWYRPDLRGGAFLVWLAVCYLVALAVETRLQIANASGTKHSDLTTKLRSREPATGG
jgi:hypothetical protein